MPEISSVNALADPQPASGLPLPLGGEYTNGSPALDGTVEEEEASTIKCICGFFDDYGITVLCEKCDTWQHTLCYSGSAGSKPDVHECIDCYPRAIDMKSATEKQLQRRKLQNIAARISGESVIRVIPTAVDSNASKPSSKKRERVVGFLREPVTSLSRLVHTAEIRAAYDFEMHARDCAYCQDPYALYRCHGQLCDHGHRLAQKVAMYLYQGADGEIYSTEEEKHTLVRVELPEEYDQTHRLLKAIERSLRHRSRAPFVLMDRMYKTEASTPKVDALGVGLYDGWEAAGSVNDEKLSTQENDNSSLALSGIGSSIYPPDEDKPWGLLKSFSGGDNESSVASSNEGSIFSIASLASSATDLSKASGYSTTQIATATLELLVILRDDGVMQPLYKTAIEGDIGPDRFVNNFRRLLKLYAENLKEEARDRIDFLAARLVAVKARHLAETILETYWDRPAAPILAPGGSKSKAKYGEDSSGDEDGDITQDETPFQDVVIPRDFLVESNSFEKLRSRFREFVHSPKTSTKKPTAKGKERAFEQGDGRYSGGNISDSEVPAFPDSLRREEPTNLTVMRFAKAFTHDPELRQLHRIAISELGKELFVTKYSRILRVYFKDRGKEVDRDIDRTILQAFRKRSAIKTIVNDTVNISIAEILNHISANGPALSETDSGFLTNWLAEHQQPVQKQLEYLNSPDAQHIGGIGGNEEDKTKYQEMVQFLRNGFLQPGIAFCKLALNIRLLCLPNSLRDIVETVPKGLVRISSVCNTSFINKLKGFAEDHAEFEWDWWPMGPRVPNPQPGTRRLEWGYCGQPLYRIVSEAHADILRDALVQMPDHPPRCHCRHCNAEAQEGTQPFEQTAIVTLAGDLPNDMQQKTEVSTNESNLELFSIKDWGYWWIYWLLLPVVMPVEFSDISSLRERASGNSSAGSKPSTASVRYTPGSSASNSATPSTGTGRRNTGSVPSGSSNTLPPQIRGQTPNKNPQSVPVKSTWILFGIQGGRWSLELEQITVSSFINDPTFFRELKARYKRHRGWFRMLLSPFRFRFCRFVKFEKFDCNRVISQGEDLPDYHGFEHDYDYAPRPGKNPLINPKTFAICLKACDPQSCIWSRLSPWHDCIKLPCRSDRVRCIPKKRSIFNVDSDDVGVFAWGLEADYALSFAFLAVYHLVPVFAAIGFWAYWLATHAGDWQNSAVPILTVLALFAAFWVPFGKQLSVS